MDNQERKTYTVQEAAALLGVNHKGVYAAIAENQFPYIRVGRRILIPRAALDRLLESGAEGNPA